MSGNFVDFEKFVQHVHQEFEEETSLDEVRDLLSLEEGYNRDSPQSTGKHLVISRLKFSGEKRNGDLINFDRKFYKGINVLIADNHKGKSSVFKIIKFALTGRNKIKRDILPWIQDVLLEFKIGKVVYTCHIDFRGRARGELYLFTIEEYLTLEKNGKLDAEEKRTEFSFKSATELEEKMQAFFFEQFSFYSMKYTQKDSAKDSFELRTSNLSWTTYYKSIYLESSNYEYLFFDREEQGAQGRKIFEMILGLPLTYPINLLSLQRDRIKENIGKAKMRFKSQTERSISDKKMLSSRLDVVRKQLQEISKSSQVNFDEKPLMLEYTKLQTRVNDLRRKQRIVEQKHSDKKNELELLGEEIQNLKQDSNNIRREITALQKQEHDLTLYKDAGSFFTNLEIEYCPHCDTTVSEEKKKKEHEHHICGLCGEKSTTQRVEQEEILQKIAKVREEKEVYQARYHEIVNLIESKEGFSKQTREESTQLYSQIVAIPSIQADIQRMEEIEKIIESIQTERKEKQGLIKKRDGLIAEEAVLRFQLNKIENLQSDEEAQIIAQLELKNQVLEFALGSLNRRRKTLNQELLNKLEELITEEIHAFGLISIEKIDIGERYDLTFIQHGVRLPFKELTEGEKLRVKLAFYLGLIQLDIEYKLGRHPRFLIFDSPGSEEMVPKHLQGLSEILKSVNDRYQNNLQIFVGSALREFALNYGQRKTIYQGGGSVCFLMKNLAEARNILVQGKDFDKVFLLDNFYNEVNIDEVSSVELSSLLDETIKSSNNAYINLSTLTIICDLTLTGVILNEYIVLGHLKNFLYATDQNLQTIALKYLPHFPLAFGNETEKVISLTDNDNADVASQAYMAMGLSILTNVNDSSSQRLENLILKLNEAKRYFLAAKQSIANRTDADFFLLVIECFEGILLHDETKWKKAFGLIEQNLASRNLYQLSKTELEFDFLVFKLIENLKLSLELAFGSDEWIDFHEPLKKLCDTHYQIETLQNLPGKHSERLQRLYKSSANKIENHIYTTTLASSKKRLKILEEVTPEKDFALFLEYILAQFPKEEGKTEENLELLALLSSEWILLLPSRCTKR